MKQAEKQALIGSIITGVLVNKGGDLIQSAVKKGLDKVARRPDTNTDAADVKKAAPIVAGEVERKVVQETQAEAEHKFDAEPHWQSRNMWGVLFGLMGEAAVLYKFSTDGIPQDFQTEWAPHILVVVGLLTPLYSRFIAKKPLFR